MKEFALISVQDKKNLKIICNIFKKYKIGIISTGGTYNKIKRLGFSVIKIDKITNFEEILDGRVKTLHPKIHGGLLFDRKNKNHIKIINKKNIPQINYVVINLYEFEKSVKLNKDHNECINNIDVGGHSLIRSAAKNYKYVTVVSRVGDYRKLSNELRKNNGKTSIKFRLESAKKAFEEIYKYDLEISNWFNNKSKKIKNKKVLKYGENPHQKARLYLSNKKINNVFPFFNKLYGKDIGYNNINDVFSAVLCLNDLKKPSVVFVKHANPCCVASDKTISKAFTKSLECDIKSAFGGVAALNKKIDEKTAKKINRIFLDVVVAKDYSEKALNILRKKEIIILKLNDLKKLKNYKEIRSIPGGYLEQDYDKEIIKRNRLNCVTKKIANKNCIRDMIFAFTVAKHVKSNSIVLAKNEQVVGIGAGQMSRVESVKISLSKMLKNFDKKQSFVLASDGFLPFPDNINLLKNTNCIGIIQPGGSKNDNILIKKADSYKIPMYFTGIRHFKH